MAVFTLPERKPINEAYFGRTPGIEKMIRQMHILRERYGVFDGRHKLREYIVPFNADINVSEELIEFNRIVEQEFGFGCFALNVYQSAVPNAYTQPISSMFDMRAEDLKRNLVFTKNGIKYDERAKYCIITSIASCVILSSDYLDEEIVAIVLHEIGHNFSNALSGKLANLNLVAKTYDLTLKIYQIMIDLFSGDFYRAYSDTLSTLTQTHAWTNFSTQFTKALANDPIGRFYLRLLDAIRVLLAGANAVISDISILIFVVAALANPIVIAAGAAIMQVFQIPSYALNTYVFGRYKDEQLADSFLTMYGMGEYQASALAKLRKGSKTPGNMLLKIPIVGHIANLTLMPASILVSMFESHGLNSTRCSNEIKMLEAELKTQKLDPKMKKQIQKDIDNIKAAYDKYYVVHDSDKANAVMDPDIVNRLWEQWLFEKLGKNDIASKRTFKSEDNYEEIEQAKKDAIIARGMQKLNFR